MSRPSGAASRITRLRHRNGADVLGWRWMRFMVLGPMGVCVAGRRVGIGRGRQRTILAVLLAGKGEVVTTDRLVDALWGQRRRAPHGHGTRTEPPH